MKRLLAIIDYQNDFVSGSLGFPGADRLDLGIAELAQKYLAQGDPILITYDTHDTNYLETREGKALPVPHCICKTEGWQLYGKTPLASHPKTSSSSKHSLAQLMKS